MCMRLHDLICVLFTYVECAIHSCALFVMLKRQWSISRNPAIAISSPDDDDHVISWLFSLRVVLLFVVNWEIFPRGQSMYHEYGWLNTDSKSYSSSIVGISLKVFRWSSISRYVTCIISKMLSMLFNLCRSSVSVDDILFHMFSWPLHSLWTYASLMWPHHLTQELLLLH